jgi:hypothetical protein
LLKRFAFFFIVLANLVMLIAALIGLLFYQQESASILIIASSVFLLLLVFSIYRSATKQYQHNQRIGLETSYQFTSSGIAISRGGADSTVKWNEVKSIKQRLGLVLIWQNKLIAHVLLRRDISDEQLESLRQLATSKQVSFHL